MRALLQRYGGVLVAPRTTVAGLAPGVGAYDGLVLLILYGLCAKLEPLARGVADFQASAGLSALIALALGFVAYLPWVLATLTVEIVLGPARRERTELCKVPLLLCAAGAGLADHLGASIPGPVFAPELVGAAWSVGVAAWVRSAVVLPEGAAAPVAPRRRLVAGLAGGLFFAASLANAGADARLLRERWSTLAPLSSGEPLRDFATPLLGGGEFTRGELDEGLHLLVFWTTWCGVCEAEMPTLAELGRSYGERGLRVIAVNADAEEPGRLGKVDAYRQAHALTFPIAVDDGLLRQLFRVRVFPHVVLIKGGEVRAMHQGRTLESTLRGEIEALLAEGG